MRWEYLPVLQKIMSALHMKKIKIEKSICKNSALKKTSILPAIEQTPKTAFYVSELALGLPSSSRILVDPDNMTLQFYLLINSPKIITSV